MAIHGPPRAAQSLSESLQWIWRYGQYALFGLIGAAVDLRLVATAGGAVIAVIVVGQLGRALLSLGATSLGGLRYRERLGCILAYIPKATIQAAFAALPLEHGVAGGEIILGVGVLAIALTAPVGVITLHRGTNHLLEVNRNGPDPSL